MTADAGGQNCLLLARDFSLYEQLPLVLVGGDAPQRAGAAGGRRSGDRIGAGPTDKIARGGHAPR